MSPHTVRVLPTLPGVPVLLYHGIRHDGAALTGRDKKYWVSIGRFQAHLSAIKDAGFDVVLLRHLQMISGAWTRPQVVLTFDDGHSSDYHSAFPALLAASMRGEFFVNTAELDRPDYLRWSELLELHRWGMSIQSHSHRHVDLSRLSADQLGEQLGRAKSLLEDRLGAPVTALAVPYGLLNRRVVMTARAVGYQVVCGSRCWPASPRSPVVSRAAIHATTTVARLRRILAGDPLWYVPQRVRSGLLYLPKCVALYCRPSLLGVQTLQELS